MENGTAQAQTLWVGKDHLSITAMHVTIDAAHEMDWQVRDFQRTPIYLGDFKFFLRQKIQGQKPFAMRYVLERWPEDAHFDSTPFSFTYDEQFVRDRDAEYAAHQRSDKIGKALIALYPVLGFLWSGAKKKLEPCGFVPRSINGVSIFTSVCLLILQGVFIRMRLGLFTLAFGKIHSFDFTLLALDYAFFFLILVDIVFRFDQHIKNVVDYPWGFGEWITKPFRKKPVEEDF
jgi:hypothetical protein